ncbi:MAG: MBL fold metallo-hydrolase, partial [Gemmatimonadota bacterium]|nr:MBL fold metallo-hydrolase [Gemmatimonadota bacterium]
VRVFGEEVAVRCEVETISGYSAHADRHELRHWVKRLGGPVRRAFVVHGEADASRAMAGILKEEGIERVHVPAQGQSFELEES